MKKARFVTSARGETAGFGCRALFTAFALALVLTGCEFLQEFLGGGGTEPEEPESTPIGGTV
ncbi:MAG: hypothetical protein LBG27_12010 [Spirochaetaceae bacterium]|nr:hypothetical protein [Spirochaetaceae bacterium]